MAYTNQNNDQKKSTNTRGATLVNMKSSIEPVLLMTSFWDDMLKLTFYPELPENQRTESKRFDRENGIITCISREKCNELHNCYENEIKPKLNDTTSPKESHSVSVTVADVNQIVLGITVGEDGEYQSYIGLIKGIDPSTLKCNNVIKFEFPKGEYIVNYDPTEGTFGERKITHNGIDVFCKDLNDFRAASSKAYIHAARCVDKTFKDMLHDGIVAIGEKVGASVGFGGTGNSRYGRTSFQGSIFDQGSNGPAMNTPSMSLDELERDLQDAAGTMIS